MKKLSSIIAVIAMSAVQAVAQFGISGLVVDSAGTGEAYATIRIYNRNDTTKAVKLGTTDVDGKFSQQLSQAGKYRLCISSVGKSPFDKDFELTAAKSNLDFGKIIMKDAGTTLGEVLVVAQRLLH